MKRPALILNRFLPNSWCLWADPGNISGVSALILGNSRVTLGFPPATLVGFRVTLD